MFKTLRSAIVPSNPASGLLFSCSGSCSRRPAAARRSFWMRLNWSVPARRAGRDHYQYSGITTPLTATRAVSIPLGYVLPHRPSIQIDPCQRAAARAATSAILDTAITASNGTRAASATACGCLRRRLISNRSFIPGHPWFITTHLSARQCAANFPTTLGDTA
jgi:hypothetical protein